VRGIVLPYVACRVYRICSCYLTRGTIFGRVGGGSTEHKMFVLIFFINLCLLLRTERDIINVHRSSCQVPVVSVGLVLMKLEQLT
jgi:hypothetical protein